MKNRLPSLRRSRATRLPAALLIGAALTGLGGTPALAQQAGASAARDFSIRSQPLVDAMREFSRVTGIQVAYTASIGSGVVSPGVSGSFSPTEALSRLLTGTGLTFRFTGPNAVTLEPAPQSADGAIQLGPVRVEGEGKTGVYVPLQAEVANPPPTYAGGQVARGGKLGLLGNRDYMETPFSQTSYTAELIENQQARSIAEVLMNEPSVRLTNPVGRGDTMTIRGFNLASGGAALFNGMRGILTDWQLAIGGLERLEIFRGPSALLNDAGSQVGGIINFVPKRASDTPLTRLTGAYMDGAQFEGHADIGRRFGADSRFGVRLNAIYRGGETVLENSTNDLAQIALGLDYRGERFRIEADFVHVDLDMDAPTYPIGVRPGFDVPRPISGRKAIQQPWETYESKHTYGVVRAEYDIADDWTMYAAHGRSRYEQDFFETFGQITNTAGDFLLFVNDRSEVRKADTTQVGLHGSFNYKGISHRLSIQGVLSDSSSTNYNLGNAAPSWIFQSNIYRPAFTTRPADDLLVARVFRTSTNSTKSIAVADTIGFFEDKLQLTLGLRYQHFGGTYDKSATTPSFAALYKISSRVSIYGNYIEALETGSTAPSGTVNAGEIFPPVHTEQLEAGIKFDLDGLAFTAALFQIERPSGRTEPLATDPMTYRYTVDGLQRNKGIELNVFGEPTKGVRLLGGLTYLDAKLLKTQGGLLDGSRVAGIPEITVNIGGELDIAGIPGLTLTGRTIYTGPTYLASWNTQRVDGWTRFDLGARFRATINDMPLTFRASVDNVTGKKYWTVFSGGGTVYVGVPRRLLLSAAVDF